LGAAEQIVEYLPVDLGAFEKAVRQVPFDVYLRISDGHYAHVFSRTTGLDYQRLAQYRLRGITELYVRSEDRALYEAFIERKPEVLLLSPELARGEKIALLLNLTEQAITEVFKGIKVSGSEMERTQSTLKSYVQVLSDDPSSLALLIKLASHGSYLYYHSVAVSVFTLLLGKSTLMTGMQLERLGMGAFLHDIGLTEHAVGGEFFDERALKHLDHPREGLKFIEGIAGLSEEVCFVIYQHHEKIDGSGFPNRLNRHAIFLPALLVGACDAFALELGLRKHEGSGAASGALTALKAQGGYDVETLKLIEKVFMPRK
jgi:HD-GYP domain-containing protein (c-di-GMP phosphodiesterase class II)